MSKPRDIVVTWPKSKPLDEYLAELETATRAGKVINFRVAHLPPQRPDRCYVVHDGFVRGYNMVLSTTHRGRGEVERVGIAGASEHWPAGFYIVREAIWFPCPEPLVTMRGFQGWRYFDRARVPSGETEAP